MSSTNHGASLSVSNNFPARGPSPAKLGRERSLSRPSSRNSVRSAQGHNSTYSLDDPVAVRNQVSTLKHTIRHQQAQLQSLENKLAQGPRGVQYPDEMTSPTSPPSSYNAGPSNLSKAMKRSSYEVLQGIAGPESNLPLPVKRDVGEEQIIQEGVPMNFGVGPASPTIKRTGSPTRTLSRIPVAAVGNARALAEEGTNGHRVASSQSLSPLDPEASTSSTGDLRPPPSPSRRQSLTPGGTTKVLADLQVGVVNARNALENTKGQLRLSQRTVAQLTRQTEDLKEGRERLRLENEGLNNVVARKERLLQEVLERARKAEAEVITLKSQLKTETSTSKKSLQEMKTALTESTALSQKSEREYLTLRDSIKDLVSGFKSDTDRLRDEMRKREEKLKKEAEEVGKKYKRLVEEVKEKEMAKEEVKKLREEDKAREEEVKKYWTESIEKMKAEVERSSKESDEAIQIAKGLAEELARLRRLMRAAGQKALTSPDDEPS